MSKLLAFLLVLILLVGGLGLYVRRELQVFGTPAEGLIIEIPRGLGARDIVGLLKEKNVIRNSNVAFAYILFGGTRNKLQAGEYSFDRPQTIPEVVHKIANGLVYLHKFAVPEGLTVGATAQKWQEEGFGSAEDFKKAANSAVDLVRQFDRSVFYAGAQADQSTGRLTLADLKFKSPSNTNVTPGLPPCAIAIPGYPSLLAAIQPADTNYLYFVQTIKARHTFSQTLAAH